MKEVVRFLPSTRLVVLSGCDCGSLLAVGRSFRTEPWERVWGGGILPKTSLMEEGLWAAHYH